MFLSDRPSNEIVREILDIDLDSKVERRDQYILPDTLFNQMPSFLPRCVRWVESCRMPGSYRAGFYDFRISLFEGRKRYLQYFETSNISQTYSSYTFRDHDHWLKIAIFDGYVLQYSSPEARDRIMAFVLIAPDIEITNVGEL